MLNTSNKYFSQYTDGLISRGECAELLYTDGVLTAVEAIRFAGGIHHTQLARVQKCEACNGHGSAIYEHRSAGGFFVEAEEEVDCPVCDGRGEFTC